MSEIWREVVVVLGPSHEVRLEDLVDSWEKHVRRLKREAAAPERAESWGVFDVIAALHLRDFLERSLWDLSIEDRAEAQAAISATDREYRSFTEGDSAGRLSRLDGAAHSSWWWDRVPMIGLARRELDEMLPGLS
jgi:hypothetical protein